MEVMGRGALAGNSHPLSPAGTDWLSNSKEIFSKAIRGYQIEESTETDELPIQHGCLPGVIWSPLAALRLPAGTVEGTPGTGKFPRVLGISLGLAVQFSISLQMGCP